MIPSTVESGNQLTLALAIVAGNTAEEWRAEALEAIRKVCLGRADFICDDVWDTGLRSAHNDKALGPVMMQAAKNGWCVKTDRVRPSRRSHLSGKPVWKSLLYGGPN